jgi:hypothetical protein
MEAILSSKRTWHHKPPDHKQLPFVRGFPQPLQMNAETVPAQHVTDEPISLIYRNKGKRRYFRYNIYFCIVLLAVLQLLCKLKKERQHMEKSEQTDSVPKHKSCTQH